jgi:hypothetical protein
MLRRAIPAAKTANLFAFRQPVAVAPAQLVARRGVSTHMSEPIGNGKVIQRKHDYVRPAYSVPSWPQWCTIISLWTWSYNWPIAGGCFAVLWGFHGGFTGHLPPDPHEIHK